MKVALHDSDKTRFPNLALMKLSAHHKSLGHDVQWFNALMRDEYDVIYSSKIFTFTAEDKYLPSDNRVIKGGTGYCLESKLEQEIEHCMPDYTIYNSKVAQGFTTRGCPNHCSWCIVPKKEGVIKANADINEFWSKQSELVLMDNNILAHEHGIDQLLKIATKNIKLDCNQGLDARLVDRKIAKIIASIKWKTIRFACDNQSQMKHVENAVKLIRKETGTLGRFFVYVLVKDVDDAYDRVKFLRSIKVDPFAQPYRDIENKTQPSQEQKDFARWVNHKAIFKSVQWEEYKCRKHF